MGLHTRDGRETDADALKALMAEAGLPFPAFSMAGLRDILADRQQTLLVTLEGTRIVGAAHLRVAGSRGEICRFLAAAPETAHRCGAELLAEAGLWLAFRGAGTMALTPRAAAGAGPAILRAAGFRELADKTWTRPLACIRQLS